MAYETDCWYCPALEKEIVDGLCWEYCFATNGGPADASPELRNWIEQTKKYKDINEFHQACESCPHCQWAK
jgi:hypothetical protein